MKENRATYSDEQEKSIAIGDILLSLAGKWWLIVLVAVVFGSIGVVYIDSTYVDTYKAYGSIYLVQKNIGTDNFGTSNIQYAEDVMNDCIYRVSTEQNLRNAVTRLPDEIRAVYANTDISEAELEAYIASVMSRMTWTALRSATTISNPEETHYLYISVVSTDPKLSYAAASAILGSSLDSLSNFFAVEQVSVDEQPRLPVGPSSHKSYKNAFLFALIGAALVVGVLVLLYLRDDKINTSEDIEKYLGITVLSLIPEYELSGSDAQNGNGSERGRNHENNSITP